MTTSPQVTGARLGGAVLGYIAMTIAVITLAPFRFLPHIVNDLSFEWRTFDVVMNVIMFVPIGFIHLLARRSNSGSGWLPAVTFGGLLSVAIECTQFFAPGRFPSVVDVVTNTAGAGLGALLAAIAFDRTDGAKAVRAFAVELPLMGIVYLLLPLTWLVALAAEGEPRAWTIALPVVCAGWIIGAAFTSFERAPLQRVLLANGVWLFIALAPAAIASPRRALVFAAIGMLACVSGAMLPSWLRQTERRFEAPTLRVVLPLLFVFLVVTSLVPLEMWRGKWTGMIPLFPSGQSASNTTIFRALEHIAAFTVLAYAIAEYGGRVRDELRRIVPIVLSLAAVSSGLLEVARGWHPLYGASASMFILTVAGAGIGGWLYVLQLAHVRALIAR
jgi:glycopeptide antibiotics resistance protein